MNNRFSKTILSSAVLLTLSCGLASAAPAASLASTDGTMGTIMLAEAKAGASKELGHVSEAGLEALRHVYAARFAIFEGQAKEAEKLLKEAKEELAEATKDVGKVTFKGKKGDSGELLPIDARLTLADDFILTPAKAEKIGKVDEHLKKGENKEAVEVLREAGIFLNVTAVLLPLEATKTAVDKAAKLISEDRYYDANLVLKSVEDGVVVDSESFVEWLDALPKKTDKG